MIDETIATVRINNGIAFEGKVGAANFPRTCTATGIVQREGEWFVQLDHPYFAELHFSYVDPMTAAARTLLAGCRTGIA